MYPPFGPIIQVGPLSIHWYGIIMTAAIFVGALVASRYVERHKQDPNTIWEMLLWVLIPAIIGARLYFVFIQSPRGPNGLGHYLANPIEILEIWRGGIHKAIGRLGNFMNQELYGPPTTLPWGLRIDSDHRVPPYNNLSLYPESVRFQPLFLYESIWNLIGFFLLFFISRRFEKRLRDGDLFLMYLIWYPLGRFFLEFMRTDSWFFPGTPFNVVHLLSTISIVGASVILFLRHRPKQPTQAQENESSVPAVESEENGVLALEEVSLSISEAADTQSSSVAIEASTPGEDG